MKSAQKTLAAREKVLETAISVFNKKGMKFTMDDVAAEASMSKKTIYVLFHDKNTMLIEMVDYCFDQIKESERKVLDDQRLSTVEKVKKILGVLPEGYKNVDFSQLYQLKDKYPDIYQRLEERLESGWEETLNLMKQGMEEGSIRKVNLVMVKTMFEASLEQFFKRDVLISHDISYRKALDEVVSILVDGIKAR
ncbi:MAG: TetR/AcrR family transcriptional regulator [Lachnospiraceae bacterium]|nr:TetR/AcrR family transcriptional regulator [Lachnospiraceae bacterium]